MSTTHLRYPKLDAPQVLPLNDPHPGAWYALSDVIGMGKNVTAKADETESIWRLRCPGIFRHEVRVQSGVPAMSARGVVWLSRSFTSSPRLRALAMAATVDGLLCSDRLSLLSHDRAPPDAVYRAYVAFCSTIAARPMSPKGLTLALNLRGFTRTRSGAHPRWVGIAVCPF